MITQITKFLQRYSLIFTGLLIVLYFIWARYLRIRFSKDIPLPYLSIRGFLIITTICCIYIIVIKHLIKPSIKSNIFTEYLVPLFYIPLETFDVEKIVLKYHDKLKYLLTDTYIFYFIFAIVPRLLLVTVLFMDTFIFHKLHYLYYFIYFSLLLFLNRYIIYSLKVVKKNNMEYLKLNVAGIGTPFNENAFTQEEKDDPEYEYIEIMGFEPERTIDYFVNCSVFYHYTPEITSITVSDYYYHNFEKTYNIPKSDSIFRLHADIFREEEKKYINT